MPMQNHAPRPRFLRKPTPRWVSPLIALAAGFIIGTIITLNL